MDMLQKIFGMISYNAPVVLTFALCSLAALLLNRMTSGAANRALFSVYRSSPLNPLFYVRLFGHVLGHTSLSHYAGNMMLFLLLGPMVESACGSNRLLMMIAVTALVTGLLHLLFSRRTALCGASGIVFMMIPLSSLLNYDQGQIPLTFILVVLLYLGRELHNAVTASDNVSQLTHIAGAVLGVLFALFL